VQYRLISGVSRSMLLIQIHLIILPPALSCQDVPLQPLPGQQQPRLRIPSVEEICL